MAIVDYLYWQLCALLFGIELITFLSGAYYFFFGHVKKARAQFVETDGEVIQRAGGHAVGMVGLIIILIQMK